MSPIVDRGRQRHKRLQAVHRQQFNRPLSGRVLDFGCGAGGFLMAGREAGLDVHGVEVEPIREGEFHRALRSMPELPYEDLAPRFTLYDGADLPYPRQHFDGVVSYFVFEHVPDTFGSLRQIARVMKSGATLMLFAEEARNGWEGHPQIPWPPFLPRRFTHAYLDEYGGLGDRTDFINEHCYYVTGPMIASALEAFGLDVIAQNTPPPPVFPEGVDIMTENDARQAARVARARFESGDWTSPKQNLEIFAIKRI